MGNYAQVAADTISKWHGSKVSARVDMDDGMTNNFEIFAKGKNSTYLVHSRMKKNHKLFHEESEEHLAVLKKAILDIFYSKEPVLPESRKTNNSQPKRSADEIEADAKKAEEEKASKQEETEKKKKQMADLRLQKMKTGLMSDEVVQQKAAPSADTTPRSDEAKKKKSDDDAKKSKKTTKKVEATSKKKPETEEKPHRKAKNGSRRSAEVEQMPEELQKAADKQADKETTKASAEEARRLDEEAALLRAAAEEAENKAAAKAVKADEEQRRRAAEEKAHHAAEKVNREAQQQAAALAIQKQVKLSSKLGHKEAKAKEIAVERQDRSESEAQVRKELLDAKAREDLQAQLDARDASRTAAKEKAQRDPLSSLFGFTCGCLSSSQFNDEDCERANVKLAY